MPLEKTSAPATLLKMALDELALRGDVLGNERILGSASGGSSTDGIALVVS
jgi:hypothetical protein